MTKPWIGVDLDGTLAEYYGWRGPEHIGEPILLMVETVKGMLMEGKIVKIFTARVSDPEQAEICRPLIEDWTERHIGTRLEVVCCKDFGMVLLLDDRARRVQYNTGVIL